MKTPRELILQHHQKAETALGSLTPEMLAAHARESMRHTGSPAPLSANKTSLLAQVWNEMFAPWRKVWLGLAAAWIALLIIHHAQDEGQVRMARQDIPSPETLQILAEQRRILAQLIEPMEPQPPAEIPRKPSPRSDLAIGCAMV